jgi:polyisoprenoid-binding protein YceI
MKAILVFLLIGLSGSVFAQAASNSNIYICKKGKIHFFSSSPLEDIEATSNEAAVVLNTQDKTVNAKITQTSFVFKDKLMQEHFNENYMETDKYPISLLKMVIAENIDFTKDGVQDITLKGTLDMHGVKQEREIKGKLTIAGGVPVKATAVFDVKLVDHQIKIPKAVMMNIAEVIKVDVDFALEKYQKP